eukprot:scaffold3987_cov134-Cylindrotheca_fusiformis.AAC.4
MEKPSRLSQRMAVDQAKYSTSSKVIVALLTSKVVFYKSKKTITKSSFLSLTISYPTFALQKTVPSGI